MMLLAIVKAFTYKKYTIAVVSFGASSILTAAETFLKLSFFGINYSFLLLATFLIMVDFFTGIIASKKEGMRENNKKWFESSSISYTVYKFLSIFLLLWLTDEVYRNLETLVYATEKGFAHTFYVSSQRILGVARATVFFLICGREFVSIGENIERTFGKKPYIFKLFSKLLDVIEIKFIRKIEESNYCSDDKNNTNDRKQ